MDNNSQLLKFKKLNIVDYLNKKHPKYDEGVFKHAKDELNHLLKALDEGMHKYFSIQNESILNILEIYQQCHESIIAFNDIEFKEPEEEENISSKELEKKFGLFENDMSIFLTNDRFHIKSDHFKLVDMKSEEKTQAYCILPNDILLLGIRTDQKSKYKIKRVINNQNAHFELLRTNISFDGNKELGESMKNESDNKKKLNMLKITTDSANFLLEGDETSIIDLYQSFNEIYFKYRSNKPKQNIRFDFIDFCIETRNFINLKNFISENSDDILLQYISDKLDNLTILNQSELKIVVSLHENPTKFCTNFYITQFKERLASLNKIKRMSILINDVFDFLTEFSDSFIKSCEEMQIPRKSCILSIESFILELFESLKPRIFGASALSNSQSDIIKAISEKLKFCNLDFRYLIKNLELNLRISPDKHISLAKMQIDEKLESYLN